MSIPPSKLITFLLLNENSPTKRLGNDAIIMYRLKIEYLKNARQIFLKKKM